MADIYKKSEKYILPEAYEAFENLKLSDMQIIKLYANCSGYYNNGCEKCPLHIEKFEEKYGSCSLIAEYGLLTLAEKLQAENAALRERLEKTVELPFSIGDMAYYCDYIDYKGYVIIERKIVGIKQIKNEPKWWDRRESFMAAIVQGKKQDNDEIGEWCYDIDAFGTEWWTDRAAAEKRLKELGGEK